METYQAILNKCNAEGSWSMNSGILRMIGAEEQFRKILAEGTTNETVCLTILVLQILKIKFGKQKGEWSMIEKKSKDFIKISQVDKQVIT